MAYQRTGFINHYEQHGSRPGEVKRFTSPPLNPHRTLEKADWAAERVERGTGGAVFRIAVQEINIPEGT